MKIKRVDILGFKSFVDKTSLEFGGGIVGIVGPNGCGKSNIVDAIRWVMGEQSAKNLRGRMMEDIIFGGSEIRKPLGMAEVSLVFANEEGLAPSQYRDFAEIMVTRRLFRDGESEYLINKTPCRLLDITELFMDTGVGARAYSIIEQGKIGQILSAKPEDRRVIIEEAAGVTKFKNRKRIALRKIEATRQNLVRLNDVIGEVRRQMNSLKRQAQKAERFRSLREEARAIELRFARERFRELRTGLERLEREEEATRIGMAQADARVAEAELDLERIRLGQAERERELAAAQELLYATAAELQKVEDRIEYGLRQEQGLVRQAERTAAEQDEIGRRLAGLEQEEQILAEAHAGLGAELAAGGERLREAEGRLEELLHAEAEISRALESSRQELFALLTELSRLGSQREEARRRLTQAAERMERNHQEAVTVRRQTEELLGLREALSQNLAGFRLRREELLAERISLAEKLEQLRQEREENEGALLVRREELGRRQARHESLRRMEESLEGYGRGVRNLLSDETQRRQFHQVAADLLDVPVELETAVEAVLGDRLQALPVSGPQSALAGIRFLAEQGGRCTFLLPGFAPQPGASPAGAQALLDLVRPREGGAELTSSLLADVYLVDSVEPYLAGGVAPGAYLVSRDGTLLGGRGELTGGGREVLGHGLLQHKREMKTLAEEIRGEQTAVRGLEGRREELRGLLTECEERLREVEAALHRKDLKVMDSEKDLARLEQDAARLGERLEVLGFEEEQLREEKAELLALLAEADSGSVSGEERRREKEAETVRRQDELLRQRALLGGVRETVTALKVQVTSFREREESGRSGLANLARLREELRGRSALLAGQMEEQGREQERLRLETQGLRRQLEELALRREEERRRFDLMSETLREEGQALAGRDRELREWRQGAAEVRTRLAEQQLRRRELELELEHLREGIRERYREELDDPDETGESLDGAAAEARLAQLREAIEQLGEVNLTAIEEFRELEERYEFLTTQEEDLRQSLDDLQKAIARINRTTRQRFRETFDQVNLNFQQLFPRLFRGGQARLVLTDEQDLLETGVDIEAQPPGKKLQNVTLLSGGEKALTAVALIFAIFLLKPTPFCLLDEVDAPLDDANIGRFNELVNEMARNSQFIIITHNKRTMEMADTLYGVTMEDPGVSKIVSVRVQAP